MKLTIHHIAGAVFTISFLTAIIFFGRLPQFRNTPIGWLHRILWIQTPGCLRFIDLKLTNGRLAPSIVKLGHYLLNDRHPLVLSIGCIQCLGTYISFLSRNIPLPLQNTPNENQIFFMLLLGVSEFMFLPIAWPLLSNTRKITACIIVTLPWVFLYASAASDPGYISQANHSHRMSLYPYDFTIFYPGQFCRTCSFLKPARSKHCSVCKRCISKLDHHCIFINNCVGYRNHHYFLLLLLTTALLTAYATYVGISLLSDVIRHEVPVWNIRGSGYSWTQYGSFLIWALNKQMRIGAVTLLCSLTCPLVWGLLSYHFYLIWAGTTTNETMKWSDLGADMSDGFAFRRFLPSDRVKDERFEPLWTRWPLESEHVISRSYDGRPPRADIIGTGEWQRIWKLADIQNLYDLGLRDNLRDIFWPECSFKNLPNTGKSSL